jgi:hypothetical protein
LKKTPLSHPDYQSLNQAHEAFKTLADLVNEKKRQEEERTGLFQAFSSTKNCPANLVSAKRRWVVTIKAIEMKTKKEISLMIFSDLLMVTVPNPKSLFGSTGDHYTHRFVRWMDLLEIDFDDIGLQQGILG